MSMTSRGPMVFVPSGAVARLDCPSIPGSPTVGRGPHGHSRRLRPRPPKPKVKAPPHAQAGGAEEGGGGRGREGPRLWPGHRATPAASLFAVKERLVFQVQIPQAMQLFKASEGRRAEGQRGVHGEDRQGQHIHLPELPQGDRYMYDPRATTDGRVAPAGEKGGRGPTFRRPPDNFNILGRRAAAAIVPCCPQAAAD